MGWHLERLFLPMPIPTYDELMNPTLRALEQLGGSGSVQEIEDAVANLLNLSERDASQIHRGNRTKLGYRLAWGSSPIFPVNTSRRQIPDHDRS